jgi:hypothetical protein
MYSFERENAAVPAKTELRDLEAAPESRPEPCALPIRYKLYPPRRTRVPGCCCPGAGGWGQQWSALAVRAADHSFIYPFLFPGVFTRSSAFERPGGYFHSRYSGIGWRRMARRNSPCCTFFPRQQEHSAVIISGVAEAALNGRLVHKRPAEWCCREPLGPRRPSAVTMSCPPPRQPGRMQELKHFPSMRHGAMLPLSPPRSLIFHAGETVVVSQIP